MAEDLGFCIRFAWVPSHVDIIGNKHANEVAKTGSILSLTTLTGIPISDLHCVCKRYLEYWPLLW